MRGKHARRNPGTVPHTPPETKPHTAPEQDPRTKYSVLVVDSNGIDQRIVNCHNLDQCREVVRVEAYLYGPMSMFLVMLKGKPVETWTLSERGELRSRKHLIRR